MKKVFAYGFEADEFMERLVDFGHYNAECAKCDGVYIVTW